MNDGGKTFSSVVRNQPTRTPAQTPPPQSGNMNFAGSKTYGTFNRPSPVVNAAQKQIAQTPNLNTKNRYAQVNAPSYGSGLSGLLNRARDVVDPNTPQDMFKRNQTVKAPFINQTYQQQQATNPNAINKIAQTGFGVVNRVASPVKANIDLAKAGVAQVTGNQQARNNAFQSAMTNSKVLGTDIKNIASGMVESPRVIGRGLAAISGDQKNAEKAQQAYIDQLNQQKLDAIKRAKQGFNTQNDVNRFVNYADNLWNNENQARQQQIQAQQDKYKIIDPVRQAAAIADTGLTVAGFGVAGATKAGARAAATKSLEQSLANNVAKETALQTAKRAGTNEIIRQSALTGSMGGAQGAVTPYAMKDPGTVTPTDVITSAATNTLLGGAMPGTFVGLSKAADPIQNALKNTTKALGDINPLPKTQGGYARMPFGKDVSKGLSKEQTEFINDYANMLEEMGTGNGVYIDKNTGTRMTQNYRPPEFKGKTVTKEQWFEKARKEIESGRAGFGASEDYKLLPKPPKTEGVAPKSAPKTQLAKDEVILYHRTSKANADELAKTGKMYSKENTGEVFLSNRPDEQILGYGDTVVPVKVKKSDIRLDDEFPSGEQHYAVKSDRATPIFDTPTPVSAPIEKTVEQTPFGPVSKVKKSGTPVQSPEPGTQKTLQTQPNLSQATGKVDDLATGTEVSRAGKSGATAQNQTNLEPGNTYTSNKQQRGFKSNIAKDTETPLSVYKDIPGYNVKPNAKTIGSAAQRVAKDPEGTYNRLLENGIQKTDDSADALVLLRNLVENDELDKAGKLAKATAKAGTDFGQAVQIFSAFRKTTPDGALRDAWNIVNAYNAKNPKKTPIRITPEQTKKITDLANDLQNTEYGTREWAKKAALLEREKGLLTPNSFLSKVSTVQTMAQLLNPKTAIRNILGNGVLDLAEDISRLPAAGIDKALKGLGLIDERNMVLPNMKTNWANKLLGFKQGVEDVNLGIRTTGAAGNYDLTKEVFKPGSAGNKLEKLLGYELSSMDKAFFTGRYQSSLENMMKAQNVKVPAPEMKATAEAEALYATFQNNSNLSKALQKGKNAANFGQEWGLGDFILKYPKTPGNIVNVGLDYSPVGFIKGLKSLNDGIKLKNIQNIRNGELLLGRSLVGSGLIAGGAFLAKQGIISGKQDGDFDKSAADRDLGKGPFSFNITALGRLLRGEDTKARPGDITANYDWLQPNAIQLSMGANMVINNNSATQQINTNLESLGAGIDTISEQPVFRGVKDFVGDLNSQQGGGVGKAAQGVATNAFSSFVPSIVNQVGQQFDNTKRSSYSDTPVGEAVNKTKGRIPGARNTLYPSLNTLGEEQKQYDVGGNNPFNVFFNPAFLNRVKDSPALSMADELNQKTGETSQYPRSLTGKQTIDGTKTKLTPEQLFNLKKDVGQTTNSIFQQYANSPIFQNLSDTEKVKTLTNALTDITAAGKATLAAKNSLGQYAPGFTGKPDDLEASQKALISGEYNVDTKMAGTSIPKGLNQDAVKIIASYDKSKAKEASNNQTVTKALTSWNNGKPVPQVTNEIAKQWADYEKGLKDGSLTKLEAKDQKTKILRNTFNSQLNDDEKQLYKLSKTKITQALSEGLITEDNLKKALAVERQMFDNGLLESETLAKKLGLGSRSKSSGSSSRKSSGRKTSRAKSTKLKASKTPISFTKVKNRQKSVNSSLRKLLGSAKV